RGRPPARHRDGTRRRHPRPLRDRPQRPAGPARGPPPRGGAPHAARADAHRLPPRPPAPARGPLGRHRPARRGRHRPRRRAPRLLTTAHTPMKGKAMKRTTIGTVAALAAGALVLAGCGGDSDTPSADADGSPTDGGQSQSLTLWLMGGDTPDELRDYLRDTFAEETGAELVIEEQDWADAVTKLTTALPDAGATPARPEIGNTWASTFTGVGAFSDLSDIYDELGGEDLLQSFVAAGDVDGAHHALPYYFGSRLIWYRKDVWQEAGLEVPTTLAEFNDTVTQLRTDDRSGFYLGGEDWRNGISWIFANGGELAVKEGDTWVSSLSAPATQEGLAQFQQLFTDASNAPATESDSTPWV